MNNANGLDYSVTMKLIPETACLETQEKYWKGRLRELCEEHERMKNKLLLENSFLKKVIEDAIDYSLKKSIPGPTQNPQTSSIYAAPDSSKLAENIAIDSNISQLNSENVSWSMVNFSDNLKETYFRDSNNRSENFNHNEGSRSLSCLSKRDILSNHLENLMMDFDSRSYQDMNHFLSTEKEIGRKMSDTTDILHEVDSFLKCFDDKILNSFEYEEATNISMPEKLATKDVKQTISKLFTNKSNSVDLAAKLMKIYEKQDIFDSVKHADKSNSSECRDLDASSKKSVGKKEDEEIIYTNGSEPSGIVTDEDCENKTSHSEVNNMSSSKNRKFKFLPFFRNISSKISKSSAKSQSKCSVSSDDRASSNYFPNPLSVRNVVNEEVIALEKTENEMAKNVHRIVDKEITHQPELLNRKPTSSLVSAQFHSDLQEKPIPVPRSRKICRTESEK